MRNWAATYFQFRKSRFFRYDTGHKPWAHTTHTIKLNDPVLNSLTLGPWLPFTCLWLLGLSSHTGMSCMLFSRWLGVRSRHEQLWHRNHNLEQNYLDMIRGWSSKDTFLAQESCQGSFFLIFRGWNYVLLAKRPKFGTGGFCRETPSVLIKQCFSS